MNRWLTTKVPDARRRLRPEEEGIRGWNGWPHQCNEHELGQTLGDGEGQGVLVCCSPWSPKESGYNGATEQQQT